MLASPYYSQHVQLSKLCMRAVLPPKCLRTCRALRGYCTQCKRMCQEAACIHIPLLQVCF